MDKRSKRRLKKTNVLINVGSFTNTNPCSIAGTTLPYLSRVPTHDNNFAEKCKVVVEEMNETLIQNNSYTTTQEAEELKNNIK